MKVVRRTTSEPEGSRKKQKKPELEYFRKYHPKKIIEADECSLCFEPYSEYKPADYIWCGHKFHTDCIKNALAKNNKCPLCRAPEPLILPKPRKLPKPSAEIIYNQTITRSNCC